MDPKATLREIRELVDRHNEFNLDGDELDRLVELIESLDNWMKKGGFSPWKT